MKTKEIGKIRFHYLVKPFYFPDRKGLKRFLHEQLKTGKKEIEAINYIFCTDAYLLQLNQDFLGHDTYTDIITFELSSKDAPLVSDVYISMERVKENSQNLSVPFLEELHRVVFHGALHLIGFKDKTTKDTRLMRQKESEWLSLYCVSRGNNKGKD